MIQEHKELLIKDISARYLYGVYFSINGECHKLTSISIDLHCPNKQVWLNSLYDISKVKPYLRPMSSMTKDEEAEYAFLFNDGGWGIYEKLVIDIIDWLNAHHFDYRGLIEKGLAVEVTEVNNPYKN